MMIRFTVGAALLALCFNVQASEISEPTPPPADPGSPWVNEYSYSVEVRQENAFRLRSPHIFSKIRPFVKAELKAVMTRNVKFKLGGRGWYDFAYLATDFYPEDVKADLATELALRDAYMDIELPKVDIRIGHQQIVWGEALGRFFADVVNPKDLREFFLPDFDDVRIPIWALDLRYHFAPNAVLELVVSPDLTVDQLAPPGADFAFFIPPPPAGFQQVLLSDDKPESDFKSWNAGARITYLVKGWDLSWLYYTSPAHAPTLFKTIGPDPSSGAPTIFLQPEHRRVHHLGMTFTKDIASSVLRGEFVYTLGGYFNAEDITVNQGVVQRGNLNYVLGFDASLGGKVDMNAEFQQSVIFGSDNLADPSVNSWIFLRFETGFFDEKLVPELIFIVGLNEGDTQVSPRLHYNVTRGVTLTWGADIFNGPLDTLYGEFRDASRIFMNTRWRF